MSTALPLALAAAVLSGAAALVYEVVWLRMLGLVVGHAVDALTAVLAAFMAGLALGAVLSGRFAGRLRQPLMTCAWVEVGVAGSAAMLPVALAWLMPASLSLRHAFGLSYEGFGVSQIALACVLLLMPAMLMGGTLPLLSQGFSAGAEKPARVAGGLYAANTAGAVLGALAAGYWLLPALGNRATGWMAGCANLGAAALLVAAAGKKKLAAPPQPAPVSSPVSCNDEGAQANVWWISAAIAVSGAVTMIFEVAWTRALALIIGSSTYAFTAVLVAVLIGLAAGSGAYVWLRGRRPASPATFATVQAAVGISAAGVLLGFEHVPDLLLVGLRWSDAPGWVALLDLLLSVGALLLLTLCIGATFPCALAATAGRANVIGREVGRLYAVNTVGAVAGVLLGGLVLVPGVGLHGSLKIAIIASLVTAAALWTAGGRHGRSLRVGATLVAAGLVALLPPWDARVMSAAPAVYAKTFLGDEQRRSLRELVTQEEVLFYRDGKGGSVAVTRLGPRTILRINGKVDASTGSDMPTQLMLAHLPLLAHPAPRSVFVLGLGSGVTAAAVLAHPVELVDVLELEPAVIEASSFFAAAQGRSLADPRLRMVVGDGRSFLRATSARYDVIISEPSNPWIQGMAGLFSVEFFTQARARLRPGGVMLQWLQTYNLAPEDLRMVVATFRSVFPVASVWQPFVGDLLLLGRMEASPLDLRNVRARWDALPGLRADFERMPMGSWAGMLGSFVLGEADVARLVEGARLNTDDRLPLEWSAPRSVYLDTTPTNVALLSAFRRAPLPDLAPGSEGELDRVEAQYWMGIASLRRLASAEALAHFERALALDGTHVPSAVAASTAALMLGRHADALALAQRALAREPEEPKALFFAGVASWWLGRKDEAQRYFERATALEPQNVEFRGALARLRGGTLSK
jgi:spermidine synthase